MQSRIALQGTRSRWPKPAASRFLNTDAAPLAVLEQIHHDVGAGPRQRGDGLADEERGHAVCEAEGADARFHVGNRALQELARGAADMRDLVGELRMGRRAPSPRRRR